MALTIRDARPDDADTIAAFNAEMALETERLELDADTLHAGVTALISDSAKGRYWLAEIDGEIAGQLMVTYEWSDWRNGMIWWIQSVYVRPSQRRRGVFTALYRHVHEQVSRAPDACGLRLYVEHNNERAQATYSALGMQTSHYLIMEDIFDGEGANAHA